MAPVGDPGVSGRGETQPGTGSALRSQRSDLRHARAPSPPLPGHPGQEKRTWLQAGNDTAELAAKTICK